jgi:hypothetical protein
MHYKTDVIPREFEPVSKFLKKMGIPEAVPQPKLSITPSTLPASTQVIILDYSGNL